MILLERLVAMLQQDFPKKVYHRMDDGSAKNVKRFALDQLKNANIFIMNTSLISGINSDKEYEEYLKTAPIKKVSHFFSAASNPTNIKTDVAPPFETCWFQFPEKTSSLHGRRGLEYESIKCSFDSFEGMLTSRDIFGLLLHEIGPERYLFCFLTSDPENEELMRIQVGYASPTEDNITWHTIAAFLQPFDNTCTYGIAKTSDRIKYKDSDGNKVLHKIRKVVYVFPKRLSVESKAEIEREVSSIVWSHRWQVRGHWRKIKGIGKNRAGEYVLQDYTYVVEHSKGPEDLPLVKKTRILKEEEVHPV